MSGICGILNFNSTPSPSDLDRMLFMLQHRGVIDPGRFAASHIAIGYHDLRALDDPRLIDQPLYDSAARVCLAFDGRIDNLAELAVALGHPQRPDAQTVFDSYLKWGEMFPKRLVGDFAVALWDIQRDRLLLVRDPVGLKPLYYYPTPGGCLFASEAKAILAVPGVPCRPHLGRLREYERGRYRLAEPTFFEGIFRVLPGETVEFSRDGIRRWRYWRPDTRARLDLPTSADYQSEFRRIFFESVRCRLPSQSKTGILLSGGLDSSSVACVAAAVRKTDHLAAEIETYSLTSDRFPDERQFSQAVCRRSGLPNRTVRMEDQSLVQGLDRIVFENEGPNLFPSEHLFRSLYRAAAADGCRVILNGEWGDQMMTCTAILADLFRNGHWRPYLRQSRGFRKHESWSRWRILLEILSFILLPRRDTPRFQTYSQMQVFEAVFLPNSILLMESLERTAAWNGLDLRIPYLDIRLIEYILAIPGAERTGSGLGKLLSREGLAELLPPEVAGRTDKVDYTAGLHSMLVEAGLPGPTIEKAVVHWKRQAMAAWREVSFGQSD